MIESTLDPMDAFVRFVRTIAADNEHVIVGPASVGQRENHYLVEVVVAAINPTPDQPFVGTSWDFEVKPAGASGTVISAWGTWRFLADLLRRDFQSVARCGNELDFARAVECKWSCIEATAVRQQLEMK
jgi:hypothetical protein